MKIKCIAIHQNKKMFNHSTSWTSSWIQYCEKYSFPYEIVDCYNSSIINHLKKYDYLLWHFNNYCYADMLEARSILYCAKQMGVKIFPDYNDMWHFDDKIAETYYLQSVDAPIPQSWVFYSINELNEWIKKGVNLPIIAKLRTGSGSHNVKMLTSKAQIINYSKQMFGKGISPRPSIIGKAMANYHSSNGNWSVIKSRIRRIPEFYNTLKNAKIFPNEKGYVFFQDFIPNDGYDIKIVVIKDKLGFIARHTRKNDFRASGGGDVFFDKSLITKNIINSAFAVSDALGFKCMGYDYVVNSKTRNGIIIEMSYGFSHSVLLQSNGYFDRDGIWCDEPLNAPEEILKNLTSL